MRKNYKWTKEMEFFLKENHKKLSPKEIANNLGVTTCAIYDRTLILKLNKDKFRWSDEKDELLKSNFKSKTSQELSILVGCNISSVAKRLRVLKLTNIKLKPWNKSDLDYIKKNSSILSDSIIAKNLGVNRYRVSNARTRYGIKKNHSLIRKNLLSNKLIKNGMEGKKMSKESIEKRLITLFKNGSNVSWCKGLKGEEFLKHYPNNHAWNYKLTKEDVRIQKGIEKRMETIKRTDCIHRGKNHHFYGKTKENSEWARKNSERMLNGGAIKAVSSILTPTSYELKISELCIKNNLPFVYTGDGTFIIGSKNPDFVDKEHKVVIEVFSDYFKIKDYGSIENYIKKRGEYFAKYGYKTIFIKQSDIEDMNWDKICLNKLKIN